MELPRLDPTVLGLPPDFPLQGVQVDTEIIVITFDDEDKDEDTTDSATTDSAKDAESMLYERLYTDVYPEGAPGMPILLEMSYSRKGLLQLSWAPPLILNGTIIEYSVDVVVDMHKLQEGEGNEAVDYVRVHCGLKENAIVPNKIINAAHIFLSGGPSILLRIGACNKEGYGPAKYIRWLQLPGLFEGRSVLQSILPFHCTEGSRDLSARRGSTSHLRNITLSFCG
ncbi:host cell factor-like isoform X1 [Homalodisca vitripennis]|uniref:host cell factor-like isoform X1 n=1 Tax=Homalodisca vitripennis TaxID=197043 RepID=UPI001EEA77F5|nr:host cell factor-like isoform X1 [Homalodisca vitripennis]